ncbi:MAG: amino acid adenylation domain-containing protein [Chryseotalea sp. WA131a]|nr:MAG: amino acid adenylation domain-containing protein [Chryseotalea sp. WA131a]
MIFQDELNACLARYGNCISIENGAITVTYSNLKERADKISVFLRKNGVELNSRVGICLNDRSDLITSIIGVANARGIFVPIDSSLPDSRLFSMQEDLHLNCIITSGSASARRTPFLSVPHYYLEEIFQAESPAEFPGYPSFHADDSLYIYFTSGSTGKPKGIIGKNSSLLHFLQWEIGKFRIDSTARISQLISPYFDAFLRDVFVAFLSGGTVCIPSSEDDFLTPKNLVSWIDERRISLIHCVPSLFRMMNHAHLTNDNFKSLRNILLSGERITPIELKQWYDVFGSRIQLVNLYGATETTLIKSCYLIQPGDVSSKRMPIGHPINDTEFIVIDSKGKPCERLVVGELLIVSNYITKGYLNRPELDREKFVVLNAGTLQAKTAFKTGDKARLMIDGRIELLGRGDRQIKLNGIRVELDDIEQALLKFEKVDKALVVCRSNEDDSGNYDINLSAFIIPRETHSREVDLSDSIRNYLKESLPVYMIPPQIVLLEAYPLLPNGKINTEQLIASLTRATVLQPENEMEEKVLSIWKEILGVQAISTDDNFIIIGGNSLRIMRLAGRIHQEYNVRITLRDIFNNLTIKQQAQYIINAASDNVFDIEKTKPQAAYRLSSAQERIHYHYELNKAGTSYNLPMAWEVFGNLNMGKVQTILKLLTARHESLRTEIVFRDGRYLQRIKEDVVVEVEQLPSDDNDFDAVLSRFVRPFDIRKAPLIRCAILHAGERTFLAMDMHHIIADGMSQITLYSDFLKLFNGEDLQPLQIQYKDYAEWEEQFKATDHYNLLREFWLDRFYGVAPKLDLPVLRDSGRLGQSEGDAVYFKIEQGYCVPIVDMLRKQGVTPFAGFCSMFTIFLCQISGQEEFIFGINTSGRIQESLQDVVGMFTKTLPIRIRVDLEQEFLKFVKSVQQELIESENHQLYDLSDIVKELNRTLDLPVNDLIDVMFVYQNFDQKTIYTDNIQFSAVEVKNKTFKYPITLFAFEGGDGSLRFKMEYSSAYFTRNDVELLVVQFKSLVASVCANTELKIVDYIDGDVPVATEKNTIDFNL